MAELIYEHPLEIEGSDGGLYAPRTYGQPRADGTWAGWIEFHSLDREGIVLSTDRETSQPNRGALAYWATGLERVYFDGAFARAVALAGRG